MPFISALRIHCAGFLFYGDAVFPFLTIIFATGTERAERAWHRLANLSNLSAFCAGRLEEAGLALVVQHSVVAWMLLTFSLLHVDSRVADCN